jgi:hypothetical protein
MQGAGIHTDDDFFDLIRPDIVLCH